MHNEKTRYKIMFMFIRKTFVGLLTSKVNTTNHTKNIFLNN